MKDIDKLFRDKLNTEGLAFEDRYWENMEELLPNKKKRRLAFWFFPVLVGVAGILIAASFWIFGDAENPKQSKAQLNSFSENSSIAPSALLAKVEKQRQAVSKAKDLEPETTHSELGNGKNLNSKIPQKEFSNTNRAINVLKKNMLLPNTKSLEANRSTENISLGLVKDMDAGITERRQAIEAEVEHKKTSSDLWAVKDMKGKTLKPSAVVLPTLRYKTLLYTLSKKPEGGTPDKWKFWTGFNGAFAFGFSYDVPNELAELKQHESPKSVVQLGFDLRAEKNRVEFFSGLGFTRFNTRTNYKTTGISYSYDTSYYLIKRNHTSSPSNNGIALIRRDIDSTVQSYEVTHCKNCKQSFNYASLPLGFGYSLPYKNFSIGLRSQVTTHIFMGGRGEYANKVNGQTFVEKDFVSPINKGVFWDYHLAMEAKYSLNNKVNFGLSYGYSQALSSMIRNYDQKPKYWVGRVRMEFLLGK